MLRMLILYISSGGTYGLVDSERQIFEKLFMAILFYSQSFCQISAERISLKKYFSYVVLRSGLGLDPLLFVCLLDHGDFFLFKLIKYRVLGLLGLKITNYEM